MLFSYLKDEIKNKVALAVELSANIPYVQIYGSVVSRNPRSTAILRSIDSVDSTGRDSIIIIIMFSADNFQFVQP